MGCSPSKLDKEEAVQVCKDRRKFIKEAVEQRNRFALAHINYIQSLRRLSLALLTYAQGNELLHHNFFSDRYSTPPFTPEKRMSPHSIVLPLRSFESTPEELVRSTTSITNCLISQDNPSIPVEEWPQSPGTVRVESYYHLNHEDCNYGFFSSETSGLLNPSFSYSPYDRPSCPQTSPQNSQWDYIWNPFLALDQYAYQLNNNTDEEMARLSTVHKEEEIPDVEEPEKDEEEDNTSIEKEKFGMTRTNDENSKCGTKPNTTVAVSDDHFVQVLDREKNKVHELKECQSQGVESMQVSEAQNVVGLEATAQNIESEETPDFIVYVNRRPTSMVEVMKDVENQFVRAFDSAREVSVMLEASRSLYPTPNAIAGGDDGNETSSNYSEECCMKSGSHQSTLDRLYSWEKKLYEEVKCCERVRIAYEKKCRQLRSHDINGAEPYIVDRTRAAIRVLHTQLTVSMHSVESVSRSIVTLRDEELYPQLMELIHGLGRLWKTMADCHKIQKRTIDEAKLLLFSSSSISMTTSAATPKPTEAMPQKAATTLLTELRNWRSYFAALTGAQRSYVRALAQWGLRCTESQNNQTEEQAIGSDGAAAAAAALPIVGVCLSWSGLVDSVSEGSVVEGIDVFAAGVRSVSMQQKEGVTVPDAEGGAVVAAESMTEVRERVLCAGMSKAVGSLAEFAAGLAEGYEELVRKFEGEQEGMVED